MTKAEPNRAVALLIETTGMTVEHGDRIVEIGAVEIFNRRLTLRRFHTYLNPERESGSDSLALHGLTSKFLNDKPTFSEVAEKLAEFLRGAVLVVQPYKWTVQFLDREWVLANMPPTSTLISGYKDVVELSRMSVPNQKATLNALCARYKIRLPAGQHGTRLDVWALAKAYLALTRSNMH
jgi:DNA polymerase-3 subunit epsilon